MKHLIVFLISLMIFSFCGIAQDTTSSEWKLYPSGADTILPTDTVRGVVKSNKKGKVNVKKDERIDKVSEEMSGGITKKPKIRGFRIQVISSSTKSTVDGERGKFMSLYGNHRTYIDYKPPNFKLHVGNFRTKLNAEKFQNEILNAFPNTLIISDWIELPNLD